MPRVGKIEFSPGDYSIVNNETSLNIKGVITTSGESWKGDHRTGTIIVTQDGETIYNGKFTHGAPLNSTTTLFSVDINVKHKSDGSSGTIAANYNYDSGWCVASNSIALPKIPRQALITDAPNFHDEETPVIKYSNPSENNATSVQICVSLEGTNDDISYRNIDMAGTSYVFEFSDEEREILRAATVDSNSRAVTFIVKTVIEDVAFYSSLEKVFTVINATPTLNPVVVDENEETIALTGDPNILVKEQSNARVISGAMAYKGAQIKNEKIICGNKSLRESGTIEAVGSGAFIFSITDTRGNTVTQEVKVPMIEYINLTCDLLARAPDAEGDMNFTVSGNCFAGSFGEVDNAVAVYYRYKDSTSDFTEWIETENIVFGNNTYSIDVHLNGLDYEKKYTFQAMAIDKLMSAISVERIVKTIPVCDWGEEDFNFNVPVTLKGVKLIDLMYPVGKIYMSVDDTNPEEIFEGTKWESWGAGRVPVGVDVSDEDFDCAGKVGGEKETILTVDEMPSHFHDGITTELLEGTHRMTYQNASQRGSGVEAYWSLAEDITPNELTAKTVDSGGGEAHNNLQPYITCYMWKRVA